MPQRVALSTAMAAVIVLSFSVMAKEPAPKASPKEAASKTVSAKNSAFKSVLWDDDCPTAERKLREQGVKVDDNRTLKQNDFCNKFIDDKTLRTLDDKSKEKIYEHFGGNYIYASAKSIGLRLHYMFEQPAFSKDSSIKTELVEVAIDYSPELPVEDILEKLDAEYGAGKKEKIFVESLMYLKQMDEIPKKQGYLGYKFVVPVTRHTYSKDGISIMFDVPDYKKTELKVSSDKESKEINERILAALGDIGNKAKRAIEMAIFDLKEKNRQICEKMVEALKSGEVFTPEMRDIESKCLDKKIVTQNTLIKINEKRLEVFRESVKKILGKMQEKKNTSKDIPI